MEVRGQLAQVYSLLLMWVSGIELRLSDLVVFSLSHLAAKIFKDILTTT